MRNLQSMRTRCLIADPLMIRAMEEHFSLLLHDQNNWTKTYLDTSTNEEWLSYGVDSSGHGGGTQVMVKLPLPGTEKLIDLAVTSVYADEIFVACRILIEREKTEEVEFRLALICKLEELNDKSRQISIIEYTDLDSALNRKDVLGKSYKQIISDSKYYRDIANRSRKLM